MKRLLDEDAPDDEVVRLLIRAGANHHPPRSSKLRMIAALGLGSAIGLSASEVLAWLGTSSGKVALAVTVIGAAAGGTYLATMPASPDALLAVAPGPAASVAAAPSSPAAPLSDATTVAPPAAHASARDHVQSLQRPELATEAASQAVGRVEPGPRPTARRLAAPQKKWKPLPAGAAGDDATTPGPVPAAASAGAAAHGALERDRAGLTDETSFVDRLRIAADGRDRPAFERLRVEYVRRFPQGQLSPEVERLSALLR